MPANAFEFFLQRRNARVVQLLEQNDSVSGALQGLLEHLVDFADDKGVPFRDLDLNDAHVTRDNQLVARILVKR